MDNNSKIILNEPQAIMMDAAIDKGKNGDTKCVETPMLRSPHEQKLTSPAIAQESSLPTRSASSGEIAVKACREAKRLSATIQVL